MNTLGLPRIHQGAGLFPHGGQACTVYGGHVE